MLSFYKVLDLGKLHVLIRQFRSIFYQQLSVTCTTHLLNVTHIVHSSDKGSDTGGDWSVKTITSLLAGVPVMVTVVGVTAILMGCCSWSQWQRKSGWDAAHFCGYACYCWRMTAHCWRCACHCRRHTCHCRCWWDTIARILGRDEKKFRTLFSSIGLPKKQNVQGISILLCGRSLEYRRPPITLQYTAPPCVINFEHTVEMFFGTCPTVSPTLQTATVYRSLGFCTSPRKGDQISW